MDLAYFFLRLDKLFRRWLVLSMAICGIMVDR